MKQHDKQYGSAEGVKEAFTLLSTQRPHGAFVLAVRDKLAKDGQLDRSSLQTLQQLHEVAHLRDCKAELLDLILDYIRLALDDHMLTDEEKGTIRYFKRLFAIKEGDFFQLRYAQVQDLLHRQFERIYQNDDRISPEEAMHKVDLQDVFDLSYDQFLEYKEHEVRLALARGADIRQLDTAKIPKPKP